MSAYGPKLIVETAFDEKTGIGFVEDVTGRLHLVNWNETIHGWDSPRIYLQSFLRNHTWNAKTYNTIPNSMGTGNLVYTIPTGKFFHVMFIIASQSSKGDNKMSSIGWFLNGNFIASVPFMNEISYKLYSPLHFKGDDILELKYNPYSNKVDFGIICGGYLIDHR